MYPTLPIGPLSLPTGPILTICALWLGLDMLSRYGQRLGLDPDNVWNLGTVALAAGLVVARLWNVVQYWGIYQAEPLLIVSIRPSGFALWPGVIAAVVVGYAFMIRKSLDPVRVAAAAVVGCVTAGIVLNLAAFLTGSVIGTVTDPDSVPWAFWHYGEARHPVGLYQMVGLLVILGWAWFGSDAQGPGRTILLVGLLYSLLRLLVDAFVADAALFGSLRLSQLISFIAALGICLLLARANHPAPPDGSSSPLSTSNLHDQ